MARPPIPTWFHTYVVVQRGQQFLLVHERWRDQEWGLPGGRVEPGEEIMHAAVRETKEEAGIAVRLDGILCIEHSVRLSTSRVRVIFTGTALDDAPPKSVADEESLGAAWLSIEDMERRRLRGTTLQLAQAVLAGAPTSPLSLLRSS